MSKHDEPEWMKLFRRPGDPTPEEVATARDQLIALLERIKQQIAVMPHPANDAAEVPLVTTAFIFFRVMITQGWVISRIAKTGHIDACYSNLRTLFEVYTDFRYLLTGEDKELKIWKARQAVLFAMRDLTERVASNTDFPPERLARMRQGMERFATNNPEQYREFDAAWAGKRRPLHWSLKSRGDLIRALKADDEEALLQEYKILSWRAHGILEPLLDAQVDPDHTLIAVHDSPVKTSLILCTKAMTFIEYAWEMIADNGWRRAFIAFDPPLGSRPPK